MKDPIDSAIDAVVELEAAPHICIDVTHLERQRRWSEATFGPGARTAGVLDHIRKELREIEAAPDDVTEWADVAILALDGALRAGHQPHDVLCAIIAKQAKNEARTWPDWRTQPLDRASEHDRSDDPACAVCGRDNRNKTHDALELTGHLSHAFTVAREALNTPTAEPNANAAVTRRRELTAEALAGKWRTGDRVTCTHCPRLLVNGECEDHGAPMPVCPHCLYDPAVDLDHSHTCPTRIARDAQTPGIAWAEDDRMHGADPDQASQGREL